MASTAILRAAELETFDSVNSGASLTFRQQVSALRNGGFVMVKDEPCKIVQMSTSKTGKHGGAKVKFTALNIFNGSRHDCFLMSTDTIDVPYVDRKDYQLIDIDNDGYMSLFDGEDTKYNLKLGRSEMDLELSKAYHDGLYLLVTVQSAVGKESVFSFKEDKGV